MNNPASSGDKNNLTDLDNAGSADNIEIMHIKPISEAIHRMQIIPITLITQITKRTQII